MCRLYAQLAPEARGASDFLVGAEFSFLKQSNFDKKNPQKDGWGLGWIGNKGQAKVSKSPKPLFMESERFGRLAQAARSRAFIGHIRAASNPRGLAKGRLITTAACQPYTDGRWLFAHNGTLEIPDAVADTLGPLKKNVKSNNDSEVYFWLFIKFYRVHQDAAKAFKACVREIRAVWDRCKKDHPGKKAPYTSLNAVATDGRELVAFNHFLKRNDCKHALCDRSRSWGVMSFARRDGRLVVASEDMDRGSWTKLSPPELLRAEFRHGRLRLRRQKLAASPAKEPVSC